MHKLLLLNVLGLFLWGAALFGESPTVLYLTWVKDPSSTMVIQWHTNLKDRDSAVYYRGQEGGDWKEARGSSKRLRGYSVAVHAVELEGLEADWEYWFRVGNREAVYRFRTMPKMLSRPVRFVVGGDVFMSEGKYERMNRVVAEQDPDFVVLGGDIAYSRSGKGFFSGKNYETKRWHSFFAQWKKEMVAPDGRLIPVIVGVGNHDVRYEAEEGGPEELFYELFAFPERGKAYRTVDFGYLSLFILDSGHSHPIEGAQTEWLRAALEERKEVAHKMAVYHVSAFPAVYSYRAATSVRIRKNWAPLFETGGVEVAFEHHNHAFKRTFPIIAEKVQEGGVVYLGDGAWGVSPREPFPEVATWYLAKSKKENAAWVVTLTEEGAAYEALNPKGELLDHFINNKIELPASSH